MSTYLKLFENHTQYEDYLGGGEMILPNVSYCEDMNDVHYNPYIAPVLAENETVWEEYSQYICDEEQLKQDQEDIFSKYVVTTETTRTPVYYQYQNDYQGDIVKLVFHYATSTKEYSRSITISGVNRNGNSFTQQTNDCGKTYVNIGGWTSFDSTVEPGIGVIEQPAQPN